MSDEIKGIWIPQEVLTMPKLSLQEKVLLSQIIFLDGENGCTASNEYFADLLQVSKNWVSEIVNSLKKKKKITTRIFKKNGNKRVIKSRVKITNLPIKQSLDTLSNNRVIPIQQSPDTYPTNDVINNKEENIFKTEGRENRPPQTKLSVDEVLRRESQITAKEHSFFTNPISTKALEMYRTFFPTHFLTDIEQKAFAERLPDADFDEPLWRKTMEDWRDTPGWRNSNFVGMIDRFYKQKQFQQPERKPLKKFNW